MDQCANEKPFFLFPYFPIVGDLRVASTKEIRSE